MNIRDLEVLQFIFVSLLILSVIIYIVWFRNGGKDE